MPALVGDTFVLGPADPVSDKAVSIPSHEEINEKNGLAIGEAEIGKNGELVFDSELKDTLPPHDDEEGTEDVIIVTGADAALHLLPLRDDGEPALTFRSLFLATLLSCFQAVVYQIYMVG